MQTFISGNIVVVRNLTIQANPDPIPTKVRVSIAGAPTVSKKPQLERRIGGGARVTLAPVLKQPQHHSHWHGRERGLSEPLLKPLSRKRSRPLRAPSPLPLSRKRTGPLRAPSPACSSAPCCTCHTTRR